MIDHTSTRIEQQETALRRQNRRRYAFQRMLEATDRVLWQLEEMNRDGVKNVPQVLRAELKEVVELMPGHVREPLRVDGPVQDTLDSLFDARIDKPATRKDLMAALSLAAQARASP